MKEEQVLQMKPLVLAYIGDCVYELYTRSRLIEGPYRDVSDLHKKAIHFVNAAAQANIIRTLSDELTEVEANVVRRARNTHTNTFPKNADITDYHMATGFEALIGYLHLTEQKERLDYILNKSAEIGAEYNGSRENK